MHVFTMTPALEVVPTHLVTDAAGVSWIAQPCIVGEPIPSVALLNDTLEVFSHFTCLHHDKTRLYTDFQGK
jgi:hypothetical protein